MIVPQNIISTRNYYKTNEELINDIGLAYQNVIKQFYDNKPICKMPCPKIEHGIYS